MGRFIDSNTCYKAYSSILKTLFYDLLKNRQITYMGWEWPNLAIEPYRVASIGSIVSRVKAAAFLWPPPP